MDELRAGDPMVAGDVTLVPIEHCCIQSDPGDRVCWLYGFKEPVAIIVCDAAGIRAFDTEAAEVPVESLIHKIPDLRKIINVELP